MSHLCVLSESCGIGGRSIDLRLEGGGLISKSSEVKGSTGVLITIFEIVDGTTPYSSAKSFCRSPCCLTLIATSNSCSGVSFIGCVCV